MTLDQQQFDKAVWDTYYDSCFQELMCQQLSRRWGTIDSVSALAAAATASGSTVAGWTLWASPSGKPWWAAVAAACSLVAIVHATLRVGERVKRWEDLRRSFAELRVQLETVRQNVAMESPREAEKQRFDALRDRYAKLVSEAPDDLAATDAARQRTQKRLDETLQTRKMLGGPRKRASGTTENRESSGRYSPNAIGRTLRSQSVRRTVW